MDQHPFYVQEKNVSARKLMDNKNTRKPFFPFRKNGISVEGNG